MSRMEMELLKGEVMGMVFLVLFVYFIWFEVVCIKFLFFLFQGGCEYFDSQLVSGSIDKGQEVGVIFRGVGVMED